MDKFGVLRHYWSAALLSSLDEHLHPKELNGMGLESPVAMYLVIGVLILVLTSEPALFQCETAAVDWPRKEARIMLKSIIWQLAQHVGFVGSRIRLPGVGEVFGELAERPPS